MSMDLCMRLCMFHAIQVPDSSQMYVDKNCDKTVLSPNRNERFY
jgi:hypothetical protein